MLDMIMLCHGDWIDPNEGVSLTVDCVPGTGGAVDRFIVLIHNNGLEYHHQFTSRESAQNYADGIGRQVNRARQKARSER